MPREGAAADEPRDSRRFEPMVVPVAGGDSDIGFGVGALISLTKFVPGYKPYGWRVEGAGFITFKKPDGEIKVPYQDTYLSLVFPGLFGDRLRFTVRPSFTRTELLKYHGLGNASPYVPRWKAYDPDVEPDLYEAARKVNEYGLAEAELQLEARVRVAHPFYVALGVEYTQSWIDVYPSSKLLEDRRGDHGETVRALVAGPERSGSMLFRYALLQDTRDDETSPTRGVFNKVAVRLSPGGTGPFPYRYAGVNGTFRIYLPLWKRYLSVAARAVADVLVGDPPIYELARYDEGYALGGVDGVRGVPAQRYYGKMKLFGNLEVRVELPSFTAIKQKITFGLVGFADGGRLWTDYPLIPALDGTDIGLKYGTGGGVRLQVGKSFVLRVDAAWSPDADPIGLYFKAGQIF